MMRSYKSVFVTTTAWLLILLTECNQVLGAGRAILGVDLGSLYMKVALVQSGSPLEIVTNLHSKRKTEQMVLFDNNQRFYGSDASALLAKKSQKTPTAMSVLLGRDDKHPIVEVLAERHYPLLPVYNETRAGVTITVDGVQFTPEELVAMVLTHAVDISVAYSEQSGNTVISPRDCALTIPSFATIHERKALLDAATLADLNVLTLIDENTAAALHYAMDKSFEEEQLILFYNLGASSLQVSLVRFYNYEQPQKYGKPKTVPALEVLAKSWDETCGGLAFDHLLVEKIADEFNKKWHEQNPSKKDKDVRSIPRAMTKIRIQANKIKHVLSANNEIPVYMDSVYDDISLQTHMTRTELESMASDLLDRAVQPVMKVLQTANKTITELTGIELIGGGMRIPAVQQRLQKQLGDNIELGLHINADESFALGAAFAGANVSTAFRVRHVGLTDINPFPVAITLNDLEVDNDEDEPWTKKATIFAANKKMGVKKTITFNHDRDVHCELDYPDDTELLPKGTELSIERYNITGIAEFAKEMEHLNITPKIALQFELSTSGIVSLIKAEASIEETYTVEEEVEVDDDNEEGGENATDTTTTATTEDDDNKERKTEEKEDEEKKDDEKKDEEKKDDEEETKDEDKADENATNETKTEEEVKPKKKTIKVEKEKKRKHKKSLGVKTYYIGRVQPHSEEQLEESRAKLLNMAEKDKERMMLEESRNKVESYIYKIKNKLVDDEEIINKFSTEEQRENVLKLATDAEDWLYEDGYDADLPTMEDKYAELSVPFEKILLRISESTDRPEAIDAINKKLSDVENLMEKWKESMPHITDEERQGVLDKVTEVRQWIDENENKQSELQPYDDPAYLSDEVLIQMKPIQTMVVRLNKKPKPKPKKVEKNVTDDSTTENNATTANTDSNTTTTDEDGETKPDSEESADDTTTTKEEEDDDEKTDNKDDEASADEKSDEKKDDDDDNTEETTTETTKGGVEDEL